MSEFLKKNLKFLEEFLMKFQRLLIEQFLNKYFKKYMHELVQSLKKLSKEYLKDSQEVFVWKCLLVETFTMNLLRNFFKNSRKRL